MVYRALFVLCGLVGCAPGRHHTDPTSPPTGAVRISEARRVASTTAFVNVPASVVAIAATDDAVYAIDFENKLIRWSTSGAEVFRVPTSRPAAGSGDNLRLLATADVVLAVQPHWVATFEARSGNLIERHVSDTHGRWSLLASDNDAGPSFQIVGDEGLENLILSKTTGRRLPAPTMLVKSPYQLTWKKFDDDRQLQEVVDESGATVWKKLLPAGPPHNSIKIVGAFALVPELRTGGGPITEDDQELHLFGIDLRSREQRFHIVVVNRELSLCVDAGSMLWVATRSLDSYNWLLLDKKDGTQLYSVVASTRTPDGDDTSSVASGRTLALVRTAPKDLGDVVEIHHVTLQR